MTLCRFLSDLSSPYYKAAAEFSWINALVINKYLKHLNLLF